MMSFKPGQVGHDNYFEHCHERMKFILKKVLLNGWILPARKEICLISPTTGFWKKNYRYVGCFFVPYGSDRGIVRKRDYKQIVKFLKMYSSLKRKDLNNVT